MEDTELMVLVVNIAAYATRVTIKSEQHLDRDTSNAFQGCKKKREMITNLQNPMTFNPVTFGF